MVPINIWLSFAPPLLKYFVLFAIFAIFYKNTLQESTCQGFYYKIVNIANKVYILNKLNKPNIKDMLCQENNHQKDT